jgi:hypothetical protein
MHSLQSAYMFFLGPAWNHLPRGSQMPSVAALNIFILSVRRNVLVCDSCHRGNCVTYEPKQPLCVDCTTCCCSRCISTCANCNVTRCDDCYLDSGITLATCQTMQWHFLWRMFLRGSIQALRSLWPSHLWWLWRIIHVVRSLLQSLRERRLLRFEVVQESRAVSC